MSMSSFFAFSGKCKLRDFVYVAVILEWVPYISVSRTVKQRVSCFHKCKRLESKTCRINTRIIYIESKNNTYICNYTDEA